MDSENVPAELRDYPLIPMAVEELKMLTQTDIERERYEARRKAQLDHNSAMGYAKRVGAIHLCEQLLHLPETPEAQLLRLPSDELIRLAEDLKKRVSQQR